MGADIVGFQTSSSARNFSRAARAQTDAEGTDTRLEFAGREVRVNAFPISIETSWFETHASDPSVIAEAQAIRRRVGASRKILLGVDRLDYTKGIDARLHAYEILLKQRAVNAESCVLMQIAVPSRETVGEYAATRKAIEHLVGRINGDYSIPGRVAVDYFRRGYSREELIPYYLAADVMLVTPLRDGMNLVAKEFVATRVDNTGVLVLSEFAGAAQELRRALLVNPRDADGTAAAIQAALHFPKADARQRMSILRTIVRRHDVHDWAEGFLGALRS
jgi:trehalose-6-phosphate synthase